MSTTQKYATCPDCKREMVPNGGCAFQGVARSQKGKGVHRIVVGDVRDFGQGRKEPCHDCNAGPGRYHHPGCDAERCPGCGLQMLGCFGDEGCGWKYIVKLPKR